MAVYTPASHSKRVAVIVGVVALAVGLIAGYAFGRSSTESSHEVVTRARSKAADAVTALDRLTIEYAQLGAAESTETLTEAVDSAVATLDEAVAAAPWLTAAANDATHETIDELRRDIQQHVDAATFAAQLHATTTAVAELFGISPPS